MEIQYGDLTFQIPDEIWEKATQYITNKIKTNLELLNQYEKGETIHAIFPIIFVDDEGKEKKIDLPIQASKPLPLLGRVKIELPEEGLKLNVGKLKTSKTISLNEKTLVQTEEGIIEQVEG